MIDMAGQPLAIGDEVAVPDGSGSKGSLKRGRIVRMGKSMAIVEMFWEGQSRGERRRYFTDLVRLPNV